MLVAAENLPNLNVSFRCRQDAQQIDHKFQEP